MSSSEYININKWLKNFNATKRNVIFLFCSLDAFKGAFNMYSRYCTCGRLRSKRSIRCKWRCTFARGHDLWCVFDKVRNCTRSDRSFSIHHSINIFITMHPGEHESLRWWISEQSRKPTEIFTAWFHSNKLTLSRISVLQNNKPLKLPGNLKLNFKA